MATLAFLLLLSFSSLCYAFRAPQSAGSAFRGAHFTENRTATPFSVVRRKLSPSDRVAYSTSNPIRSSRVLRKHKPLMFSKASDDSSSKEGLTSTNTFPLKVIIAGAPAAGKGTQCEIIKSRYGLVHLSTGDILRAAVKEGTSLGMQAKAFMDAGKLVPDELIIGVICERLQQSDCRECGWLLDGFPRTKAQADALRAAGMVPDAFLLLDVPESVLVERVVGRRTDPVTGKIYHLKYSPPPTQEIMQRLIQRSDDTEEKIKVRYRDFTANIEAVRGGYEGKVVVVRGVGKSEEVSAEVVHRLDEVVLRVRGERGGVGAGETAGLPGAATGKAHAKRPAIEVVDGRVHSY